MSGDKAAEADGLQIDAAALKARYLRERDKRMRADGAGQYIAPTGRFAHYLDDPFVEAPSRAPVIRDVDAVQIGAGLGGLLAAVELSKAGVDDFLILDRAGDVGGVWYWNRYPGAACDIESYIYMPMLEEMGYLPTERFARGPEIFKYARDVATRFDLYRRALLSTVIEALTWDEDAGRWMITTNRGDVIRARFVNLNTGPLTRPRLPGVPGIEGFTGHSFHASRWDYAYTGGDSSGGLTGLRDKRVAVIGTGATGVQCIPHLGRDSGHLYVFQRTPALAPARGNRPTDPAWAASLQPGWQGRRMEGFTRLLAGLPTDEDFGDDGFVELTTKVGIELDNMGEAAEQQRRADIAYMQAVRRRIDETVTDRATAEALKPWYFAGCKRPCFHDEYLPTFNRPNVTLVDTDGQGVERIEGNALYVGGAAYEVDCLIYATGFDFYSVDMALRNGFEIYGRGGRSLTDKWRPGVATLHGFTSRGFPNLVIQTNAQGAITSNITHALTNGARHFAYLVATSLERGLRSFEPTEAAEQDWVERIVARADYRTRFDAECTPSYYNNEGQPARGVAVNAFYPGSPSRFIQMTESWRAKDDLEGMEVVSRPV